IVSSTYTIDLSSATIVEPAGVGSLLTTLLGQLGDTTIAIQPTVYDEENATLAFLGGLAEGGAQDLCTPTIDLSETAQAEFENPYFEIDAPNGIDLTVSDVTVSLEALKLSGSFNPDASSIEGIT